MRVAVTGGTGYVGCYIIDALLASGHDVRVLVRNKSEKPDLPAAAEVVSGELDPDADFGALVDGADALVHARMEGDFVVHDSSGVELWRHGLGPVGWFLSCNV